MKALIIPILLALSSLVHAADQPNIVLIITDDQGYGDHGCNGQPYAKTPNVDKLHSAAVALDDYHGAPTCSPTRFGLLAGHSERGQLR